MAPSDQTRIGSAAHVAPLRLVSAFFVGAILLWVQGPSARAEEGRVNVHLGLGAALLANDAAGAGVRRAGLDFCLKVDYAAHRWVAPQIGYQLNYLPGQGAAEAGVNFILVGARVRILNDEGGSLLNLWPKRQGGNAWGNLWVEVMLGWARAPTLRGANWFALSLAAGYEFSLMAPLQIGPYISYQQVVIPNSMPAFFSIGVSVSFGLPKVLPKGGPVGPRPQPRPNIKGVEGDADGDAVMDEVDKCPSTASGAPVDPNGCEYIRGKMTFPGLQFKGQTATLTPSGLFVVKRVGELIKHHPDVTVEILGHLQEDDLSPADVLKLSFARAKAVRAELARLGIPEKRMRCRGLGDSAPLVRGQAPATEQKNTRIEFRFGSAQPTAD